MRDLFIVCYDIANTKRRTQFRKALLPYSAGGQKSCYECWLTPSDLVALQTTLHALLDEKEDKFLLARVDQRVEVRCLGEAVLSSVANVWLAI